LSCAAAGAAVARSYPSARHMCRGGIRSAAKFINRKETGAECATII